MFDLLICGGTVIDGTGRKAYSCDVGIEGGRIVALGNLETAAAKTVVEAAGKVVTPGFIDIHRHADAAAFRPGFGALELSQGLTTIVNGNCGLSVAPLGGENAQAIRAYLRPITGEFSPDMPTASLEDYLRGLGALPLHCGMLSGAGVIRASVAGYQTAHLEAEQYRRIHGILEKTLAEGALGVSLGLGYAPECFYSTAELIRALAPVAGTDIPVTVHMRQEGTGVVESVKEMLRVAQELRCPMHISHLKAMGRENWNSKIPQVLRLLEQAKDSGLDVSCDAYPYTAGSTQLLHILPPDFLEGGMEAAVERLRDKALRRELEKRIESAEGFDDIARLAGWDGIYLTSLHCPEDQIYLGKNLEEIGVMMGVSPLDACCDLLYRERGQITMIDFMASEEDIISILQSPLSSVISDATYPTEGSPHPRVYGTCAHLIEHFVREKQAISLEQAVHKLTMCPAQALRLHRKGQIRQGYDADLCIFDPAELHERGTYQNPTQTVTGMYRVIVGGEIALENGIPTGTCSGKAIRRENHA